MRKFIFSITLVLLYYFLKIVKPKIENNIILKVDNEIITNFEVKNKILSTLIISKRKLTKIILIKLNQKF